MESPDLLLMPVDNSNAADIEYYNITKEALILRAVNHKLRQDMIDIIQNNKRLTVIQIQRNASAAIVGISTPGDIKAGPDRFD